MNGASFEKKRNRKSAYNLLNNGVVKSKYDQPGHAGASLAVTPRRQYESFFVVVKLRAVVRRASRRLKGHIKVHLIHA